MFTPKLKDALLHQAYRVFPDSASARGQKPAADEKKAVPSTDAAAADEPATRGPSAPGTGAAGAAGKQASRAAFALVRLMPGIHW